jgi:hypothetical protein
MKTFSQEPGVSGATGSFAGAESVRGTLKSAFTGSAAGRLEPDRLKGNLYLRMEPKLLGLLSSYQDMRCVPVTSDTLVSHIYRSALCGGAN